jgi:hypothetical protein
MPRSYSDDLRQDAIGLATSTRDVIFREPLSRFGHVLACDELLGLKTYMDQNTITTATCFCCYPGHRTQQAPACLNVSRIDTRAKLIQSSPLGTQ